MSKCKTCGVEFEPKIQTPYQLYCGKQCQPTAQYNKKWRELNYEKVREKERLRRDMLLFGRSRNVIFERDGYKCVMCSSPKDILIHHKDGNGRRSKHPNNALPNLMTLCKKCHVKIHRLGLYKRVDEGSYGCLSKNKGKWSNGELVR